MAGRTEIANLILLQLEVPPVDALDGTTAPKAETLRTAWDMTARWCMAQHTWKCFKGWWWRQQAPVLPAENPSVQYATAYRLPPDCLRVVAVGPTPAAPGSSASFSVEGDYVCTDASGNPANPGTIDINGIRWTPDTGRWSIMFQWYFIFQMAWICGKPLNASEALRERAKNDRDEQLRQARSFDAMQGEPPQIWPDTWLQARYGAPWDQ